MAGGGKQPQGRAAGLLSGCNYHILSRNSFNPLQWEGVMRSRKQHIDTVLECYLVTVTHLYQMMMACQT